MNQIALKASYYGILSIRLQGFSRINYMMEQWNGSPLISYCLAMPEL